MKRIGCPVHDAPGSSTAASDLLLAFGACDAHKNILKRMAAVGQLPQFPTPLTHNGKDLWTQIRSWARSECAAQVFTVGCDHIEVLDFSDVVPARAQVVSRCSDFRHDLPAVAHQFLQVLRSI